MRLAVGSDREPPDHAPNYLGLRSGCNGGRQTVENRYRTLVAVQLGAWKRLHAILDPLVDLVPVHTTQEALQVLDQQRIDLIICTIAFDDSRMIDFLQAVKRKVPAGAIPFICARVLPGVLPERMVQTTAMVCVQCGAATFVDLAKLDDDKAQDVLAAALTSCLARK